MTVAPPLVTVVLAHLLVLLRSYSQHAPLHLDHEYFMQYLAPLVLQDLNLKALTIATTRPDCLESWVVMDHVAAMYLLKWRESRCVLCVYEHVYNSTADMLPDAF